MHRRTAIEKATLFTAAILAVLIGMVIVEAAAAIESNMTSSSSTSSSCGAQFGYGSTNPISVLVIGSGSTGTICVKYADLGNAPGSLPSSIVVWQYNSSSGSSGGGLIGPVTHEFRVDASPVNVTFSSSGSPTQSETVTYTVSVPSNVTGGVYGVYLLQFCSLFPMVVVPNNAGSGAPQLNASEFSSWYPHEGGFGCPVQFLSAAVSAQVLGVGGGFEVERVG